MFALSARSARVAGLVVALVTIALAVLAVLVLPDPRPGVVWQQQSLPSSTNAVPTQLASAPVLGNRDVWALAVHSASAVPVSPEDIAERLPRQLAWFEETSAGRFSFTFSRTLPPLMVASEDCDAQRSAFDAAVDELDPPDNVHVLGLLSSTSCKWAGLGTLGASRVLISGVSAQSPWRMSVLVHELGHNLGLGHAQRTSCPALSGVIVSRHDRTWSPSADCEMVEYGDVSTPMGLSLPSRPVSFSPMELERLGWGEGLRLVSSGLVRVLPLAAAGPDAVHFLSADGQRYALSLRQRISDSATDASLGRDSLLVMHWLDPRSGSWILVPFRDFDPGARVGDAWVSPDGSLALRVLAVGDEALVEFDRPSSGRWVDSWSPSVTSSFTQTTLKGFGQGRGRKMVTLSWDAVDSSRITKVVVATSSARWGFPPGRGMLPFIVDGGDRLEVTIKVRDAAGNVTLHRATWPKAGSSHAGVDSAAAAEGHPFASVLSGMLR